MTTITAKKENGILIISSANMALIDLFIKSIPEGSNINITYELVTDDKSYAQLSKVHKCIRDLAAYTGHGFDEIKKEVKEKAGLVKIDGSYKSFAECGKEELSAAINSAILIGEKIGLLLY